MKTIPLYNTSRIVLVDDGDYNIYSKHKWRDFGDSGAGRSCGGTTVYMHRLIMKTPKGMITDHINHNNCDNRKENLRICNDSQSAWNQRGKPRMYSRFKGVTWHKHQKKWLASIRANKIQTHLGSFVSERSAARAYNFAAITYFGEFSCLNKV